MCCQLGEHGTCQCIIGWQDICVSCGGYLFSLSVMLNLLFVPHRLSIVACRMQQDCCDICGLCFLRFNAWSCHFFAISTHCITRIFRNDGTSTIDLCGQIFGSCIRQSFSGKCLILVHLLCHWATNGNSPVLQWLGQSFYGRSSINASIGVFVYSMILWNVTDDRWDNFVERM